LIITAMASRDSVGERALNIDAEGPANHRLV
jgi:hypothetical protein